MITTWHPALKHLYKILQEKYHQHIEKDIYLKGVFPEKPIIAFHKIKSIKDLRDPQKYPQRKGD